MSASSDDLKTCITCKVEKVLTEFEPDTRYRGGRRHTCKLCRHSRIKDWQYGAHLKRTYGVSVDTYLEMLDEQGGVCAICGQPESVTKRKSTRVGASLENVKARLVVDHNHKTGGVRGLLCRACNVGMGQLQDDIETLQRAIDYLRKYE